MNHFKKKIVSFALVSALILGTVSTGVMAAPDYLDPINMEKAKETEALYDARPVVLRQMEALNRGVVAVHSDDGVFVSWRFLGTDPTDIAFNVYRDGVKLNNSPISTKTNYLDANASSVASYTVVPIINGQEVSEEGETNVSWGKEYLSIPVKKREAFDSNGVSLGFYDINDASVGDLDGDGEYEIVVRRNPPTMDIKQRGTSYPLIEAYKLDGTHLWTIDIGPNEINDVDINFLVYDFDQDGKAEILTRSFEGTVDGANNKIGDENGDGITDYTYSIQSFPDRQYLSEGPEFLSMYDGLTGKEIARTPLLPERDPLSSWASEYKDTPRLTKRASHFLFSVAYLDGVTPSIVHVRGAWNAVKVAAFDFKNNEFKHLWTLDSGDTNKLDNLYNAGYHSMAVADIDFDGKDEILSGSFAIDHDGTFMYAANAKDADGNWVKMGHGDAFDVAMMDPDFKGYSVWACQENKNMPVNIGLHDARTGQVLFGYTKPKDTGRSRAADIDPTNRGWEMWGSTGTPIQSNTGEILAVDTTTEGANANGAPVSMNMKLYWDGDLLSELLDHTAESHPNITKWNWVDKKVDELLRDSDCLSIGGTKGQSPLVADIFGDWREEVIFRTADNSEMRIYSTSIPTEYRIPTLMHDWTYRQAIAWQNNHYNQPANVSFYFGAETTEVPIPEIYTVKNGVKKTNEAYVNEPNKHATVPVLVKAEPVVLKVGSPKALKGKYAQMIDEKNADVTPIIAEGNRTVVPLRFLAEAFGADVDWNAESQKITLTKDKTVIELVINNSTYTVNGVEKTLDVPAQILNDRTVVPVRAILESFGKELFWDARGIIVIDDEQPSPSEDTIVEWISQLQ